MQNEEDRRVTLVSLTKDGYILMDEIFPQHSAVIKNLFEDLSDDELIQLGELLKVVGYKAVDLYEEKE